MGRYRNFLTEIRGWAKESGISTIPLILSFIICRIFHGASWDNFRVLEMYRYTNTERRKVYTFHRQKKISDALNKKATAEELHTLMDKNLFNLTFKDYIKRDWYDASTPDKEQLRTFLESNETFLLKPVLSSLGKGIKIFHTADVTLDALFDELAGQKVILEGFISQNKEMSRINPSSVNTIRLITARCGDKVHIVGGGLRCGGKNAFVDNFHNGGCAYPIDIKTGLIDGPGIALGSKKRIIKHPSTEVVMCGFQVPNWEKVIETVCSAAQIMPHIGYIGWDIAVLEDGCEIVEANINYPGTNIIQLDGFFVYENILLFLKECGYNAV